MEKRGSTTMMVAPLLDRFGELLHLRVVHVLAEVTADEDEALRVRMSVRSGELTSSPKVSRKPTSRGPRHCAKDGAAMFGTAVRLQCCFRKLPPMPWLKSAIASGPYSALMLLHLLGDVPEGLVPRDRDPFLLAAELRCGRAASAGGRGRMGTDAAGAARAEPAVAERVERVPSTFQSSPSFTYAMAPHFQKQTSQNVGTVRIPLSPPAFDAVVPVQPTADMAATALAAAPVIFRNLRRDR